MWKTFLPSNLRRDGSWKETLSKRDPIDVQSSTRSRKEPKIRSEAIAIRGEAVEGPNSHRGAVLAVVARTWYVELQAAQEGQSVKEWSQGLGSGLGLGHSHSTGQELT